MGKGRPSLTIFTNVTVFLDRRVWRPPLVDRERSYIASKGRTQWIAGGRGWRPRELV